MANTYTQIYIHIVFAVQGRQNLIWFATLRRDRPDSLMIAAGLLADSPGKKVSARFPTPIHSSAR
jgi:hypothetical protein